MNLCDQVVNQDELREDLRELRFVSGRSACIKMKSWKNLVVPGEVLEESGGSR
jgi:hypothetical protein